MKELNTTIKSIRNTDIPVTIVDSEKENKGLVLFVHGFKADRHEGGRFTEVAKNLAEVGVNSIRMGFAGCDESKEDFINYTLRNNLSDIEKCFDYMLENYDIDKNHLGMVGYSMGARLTSIFIQNHPEIKTIGLWAGAVYDGFGGDENSFIGAPLKPMQEQASKLGYAEFLNAFDNSFIKINKDLIIDMEKYSPLNGLRNFKGNVIVCHGNKDVTVDLKTAYLAMDNLENANNKKLVVIDGANHGFGLWDNHYEQSKQLVDETTKFFKENL